MSKPRKRKIAKAQARLSFREASEWIDVMDIICTRDGIRRSDYLRYAVREQIKRDCEAAQNEGE